MKTGKNVIWIVTVIVMITLVGSTVHAQRFGEMDRGSISGRMLVSNGPKGPIHGGESAVSDMILMNDGWIYGSTEATWGAQACHLFRTDSRSVEHVLDVTSKLPGQVKVSDLAYGPGNTIIGGTTTYDEVFDAAKKSYEGGHLFSYDPKRLMEKEREHKSKRLKSK